MIQPILPDKSEVIARICAKLAAGDESSAKAIARDEYPFGKDDESNWVTTSMLRNSAKANWTLDELGWVLLPDEQLNKWDGLTDWFVSLLSKESQWGDPYIRRWELAALRSPVFSAMRRSSDR